MLERPPVDATVGEIAEPGLAGDPILRPHAPNNRQYRVVTPAPASERASITAMPEALVPLSRLR